MSPLDREDGLAQSVCVPPYDTISPARSIGQRLSVRRLQAAVGLIVFATASLAATVEQRVTPKRPAPAYPVSLSATRRYLVDQNGVPFLIAGESPQALMVNLSEAEAEMFFSNRQSHGFNTVWINLLCKPYTGGQPDGSTYDGISPFTTPDDLSRPNLACFERCDRMIQLAARHGLLVMLDPIETGDFLKVMEADHRPVRGLHLLPCLRAGARGLQPVKFYAGLHD